jgi:hypothetical protein
MLQQRLARVQPETKGQSVEEETLKETLHTLELPDTSALLTAMDEVELAAGGVGVPLDEVKT